VRFWWCGKWVVLGCWGYDGYTTDVEMCVYIRLRVSIIALFIPVMDVVGKGVGQRVFTMVKDL
jgi:hypothetical protein